MTTRRATMLVMGSLPLLVSACQTVEPDGRHAEPPRPVPDAPPERVVPAIFKTVDTDSNGNVDSLVVFAYLFPSPSVSPLPVYATGEFRFSLIGGDDSRIAEWVFPASQVLARRDADTFGPTHSFVLDIKAAAGTDRVPNPGAFLWATFIRTDGVVVSSADGISVRLSE